MYEIFRLLLSNSGSQGPAHGLRTKLPRRIDRIRGSLKVHQHSETSVKPLEDIPTVGELKFRGTPGDRNILNLGHELITVLDPDMAADGSSIISQSYPESNFLTRGQQDQDSSPALQHTGRGPIPLSLSVHPKLVLFAQNSLDASIGLRVRSISASTVKQWSERENR